MPHPSRSLLICSSLAIALVAQAALAAPKFDTPANTAAARAATSASTSVVRLSISTSVGCASSSATIAS